MNKKLPIILLIVLFLSPYIALADKGSIEKARELTYQQLCANGMTVGEWLGVPIDKYTAWKAEDSAYLVSVVIRGNKYKWHVDFKNNKIKILPITRHANVLMPADKRRKFPTAQIEKTPDSNIALFRNRLLKSLKKQKLNIVKNIYLNKGLPQEAIIMMEPRWHHRNKHLRKNDGIVFWKLWASINSPKDPDYSRIKMVSINRDTVGGSRAFAGSMIWVEE